MASSTFITYLHFLNLHFLIIFLKLVNKIPILSRKIYGFRNPASVKTDNRHHKRDIPTVIIESWTERDKKKLICAGHVMTLNSVYQQHSNVLCRYFTSDCGPKININLVSRVRDRTYSAKFGNVRVTVTRWFIRRQKCCKQIRNKTANWIFDLFFLLVNSSCVERLVCQLFLLHNAYFLFIFSLL